jgi:hypothetical protein
MDERKAYESPELIVYGDVREITRSATGSMGDDGATKGNSKTA